MLLGLRGREPSHVEVTRHTASVFRVETRPARELPPSEGRVVCTVWTRRASVSTARRVRTQPECWAGLGAASGSFLDGPVATRGLPRGRDPCSPCSVCPVAPVPEGWPDAARGRPCWALLHHLDPMCPHSLHPAWRHPGNLLRNVRLHVGRPRPHPSCRAVTEALPAGRVWFGFLSRGFQIPEFPKEPVRAQPAGSSWLGLAGRCSGAPPPWLSLAGPVPGRTAPLLTRNLRPSLY